ncbi:protein lap4 [Syngnathoides biaculeatus]|uniref:protein lap4 n=1 Tax=Syngnathoides biaculeatus TaxID=300417 RepID=UPI002ADDC4BF|nr:protein lap4 [Syngnathoides biaculeatus]
MGVPTSSQALKQDAASQLTSSDSSPRRFRHQRNGTREGRIFQPHGPVGAGCGLHGDPAHGSKIPPISRHLKPALQTPPQHSLRSQVPLALQIRVSGQRDGLGISIAGGRGSLPYKDRDEGIFISRVTKGGASEKAGVHVGDRLLQVNSLSMQGATHLEAVRALRNAGSCIKMRVLREGSHLSQRVSQSDGALGAGDAASWRPCSHDDIKGPRIISHKVTEGMDKSVEDVVCNSNGINDLRKSQFEAVPMTKGNDSRHVDTNTMKIPRIILTHPSTSDEDVELLPQVPRREAHCDADIPESRVPLECFDSAFYPP